MNSLIKLFSRYTIFIVFVFASFTGFSQQCLCYADRDGDGFGDPADVSECFIGACDDIVDWQGNFLYAQVPNNLDCDDNNKDINPNTLWYEDKDNDKFTTGNYIQGCSRPTGYKLLSELYQPEAICGFAINVLDYIDCDDTKSNSVNQFIHWFIDNDEDSAVANKNNFIISCSRPIAQPGISYTGFTRNNLCNVQEDCNDNDPVQNPNQDWYLDDDGDGYPLNSTPEYSNTCQKPAGDFWKTKEQLISLSADCNDQNAAVYPGLWYEDKDGDGLISGNYLYACIQPPGYIFLPNGGGLIDCDDNDSTATIVQGWFPDADGDHHGGAGITACKGPAGYFTLFQLTSINDCNDNDNKVHPGALEYCNGIDDNCDGKIDEIFCCPGGNVLYVKANAGGTNNGTTWANAFKSLQDALETASRCNAVTQIWVAGGTYYPDEGATVVNNNIDHYFSARNNLAIYGGFAGTETQLVQRNLNAGNASILSGEIQQDNDKTNNSNNIFIADNVNSTFLLDGFTIRDGYSNIVLPEYKSKGIGILVQNNASPFFKNCIVSQNTGLSGSAITAVNSSPIFYNCVISNNTTNANGAIWNDNASPSFINCSVANNAITGSEFIVIKNTGTSAPILTNCIVRGTIPAMSGGTPSVSSSIIQDASVWPGTGNLNADPLFVNEAGGDLRLTACSPAVNAGGTVLLTTDILDLPRVALGKTDMGAYELQSAYTRLYVNYYALGAGSGSSWNDAYTKLNDALNYAKRCQNITEIWVAGEGIHYTDEGMGVLDNDRTNSFSGRNGLAVYGGFKGDETNLSERNAHLHLSLLSGEIQQDDDNTNNAYRIFNNAGIDNTFILDGFILEGASCPADGGGMANVNASPVIRNCIFRYNTAMRGGAVSNSGNSGSNPSFSNVLFHNNSAITAGGAIFNTSSSPVLINCTVANNFCPSGAGLFNQTNSFANLSNCIVWANTGSGPIATTVTSPATVSYSIVQGGFPGTANSAADPLFTDTTALNYTLMPCSPAINTGTSTDAPPTDITGALRPKDGFDMGVYDQTLIKTIYVDAGATGIADGSNWKNACPSFYTALQAYNGCELDSIVIAGGTYMAPAGKVFTVDRTNGVILGGYPAGGGARNPAANPVILKGEINVVKSIQIDGLRLEKQ